MKPVKIWIYELTRDGTIILAFNQELNVPKYKLDQTNSTDDSSNGTQRRLLGDYKHEYFDN